MVYQIYQYRYSRNGIDHIEAHFHGAFGVILSRFWQSGDTIITVAQDFNPQTVVVLGKRVEKQLRYLK